MCWFPTHQGKGQLTWVMDMLEGGRLLLLDGGLSNELNKRVSFDIHKEPLWTAKAIATDPDAIIATHLAYLEAGADIIETASYQATLEGFNDFMGVDVNEAKQLIKKSAVLAKVAATTYAEKKNGFQIPLVAGSIGPYGVYLRDGSEYSGNYMASTSVKQIEDMHLPRIMALVEGGVDLLAIETMPSLKEVEIILNLLRINSPATKAYVSFSIKDPLHTAAGDNITDAYQKMKSFPQVFAFGINCCSPNDVSKFLKHIQMIQTMDENVADRKIKIVAYPNSGQNWIRGQGWIDNEVPTLDSYLHDWVLLGGSILGGCCQVGTEQIKKMRKIVDKLNSEKLF